MNEIIQDITIQQWDWIARNLLPGGSDVYADEHGIGFTNLWLFRDEYQHIMLCISSIIQLAMSDALVYQEIIRLNHNPELFDIYDFDNECLIEDEVRNLLNYYHVGSTQELEVAHD